MEFEFLKDLFFPKKSIKAADSQAPSAPRPFVIRSEDAERLFDSTDESFTGFVLNGEEKGLPKVPNQIETTGYLMQNALILIDSGEWELARMILSEITSMDEMNLEAIRWTAWCFWKEGQLDKAATWYKALTEKRKAEEDFFELGEIYYQNQKFDQAQGAWLEAMKVCGAENPRLFDIYKNLGNVATVLGDFDGAEEQYNKALTLRPDSDVLQVNMGTLMYQQGDSLEALHHFKSALEINPENERAWCGVAMAALSMSDIDFAKEAVGHALEINPQSPVALQLKNEESLWKSR